MVGQKKVLRGFTLVELLVVVIIIGILAAITIIAYKTSTAKAYNATIIAGIQQYEEAIQGYRAKYGHWPPTTRTEADQTPAMVCLGTGYASQECGSVSYMTITEDSIFNDAINHVIGSSTPPLGKNAIGVPPESFIGAVYGIDQTSDNGQVAQGWGYIIDYALTGEHTPCGIDGAYEYNSSSNPASTACEIYFAPIDYTPSS